MGLLETVLGFREFDLNDDVLMKFSDYFDEESKTYNEFSLDDERPILKRLVQMIRGVDLDSQVFVCTYGYEITNSHGETSTYADTIWIDTILPISKIEELIAESGIDEPSDISLVGSRDSSGEGTVWLISESEENIPEIIEFSDRQKIDTMLQLYWD